MSTQYDILRKSAARIAGIAVIVGALAIPAFADTTMTTTTTTTSSMAPAGMTMIDYSVLINPPLNHFDIQRARAYGLTITQIGRVAALAAWSGGSAETILDQIENGATFSTLAQCYGVPLNRLMGETEYTDWVHNYWIAYRHTGMMRMRHPEWTDNYTTETTTTTTWDND